jgi:glycosyltransferase involved in cell wall biosynthesis
MKTIAVICDYALRPDRIGGMDRFFKLYDTQLKKQGHTVEWYFTNYTPFNFYENITIYSAKEVNVEQLFMDTCLLENKQYDAIVTHFTELCTPFYKQYHQLFSKAKIIAVDHNPRPLKGFPFKKRIVKKMKSILYSRYIDTFIAVSDYSKKHLIKDFTGIISSKIKVILNGIETDKIQLKTSYLNQHQFMVASHLRKEKGVQDILQAIADLPKELKEKLKLDIYGEGAYEKKLINITESLNLTAQVNFKGSVYDLGVRYLNYDYLLHASYGETYCYSVVEALTAQLPVITTSNVGNVLQLVKHKHNGFLFEVGDIDALTIILKNILTDGETITETFFKNVLIPNMSLQKMVDKHIKILP